MEVRVLSVGDLMSISDTRIIEEGRKGKDVPHFILRPQIHHEVVGQVLPHRFLAKRQDGQGSAR